MLILGYWLRFTPLAPEWLRDASGGAAYVVLVAVLINFVWVGLDAVRAAAVAFAATCLVEFLQLVPALDAIRRNRIGRLVLGSTFNWSDFPPYFVGAVLGYWLLRVLSRQPAS